MIRNAILKLIAVAILSLTFTPGNAGTEAIPKAIAFSFAKPYKVLTVGKRITVQSKADIAKIVVWTAKGHRFIEDNSVNTSSYSFTVTMREKFVYMMLELKDGRRFTEKIGIAE
jgi:hypothetical protein